MIGTEHEYSINDSNFKVLPISDVIIEEISGKIQNEFFLENVGISKELQKHVIEFKPAVPRITSYNVCYTKLLRLETNDVDVLSTPELNRNDNGLDHILTRLGSTNRVAIELNFSNLLKNKNYERSKVLWAFQRNLMLSEKYDTPVVLSSGASDIYGIKAPGDLRGFLNTLVDPLYAKKIMETTSKIVDYRLHLKKSNVLIYGLEVVEE